MNILVACESSGRVRQAFRDLGHNAWSCDILPPDDDSAFHFQCDVRQELTHYWDMLIAFPPCTYLCGSGMHWTTRGLRDPKLTDDALEFVKLLMHANIPRRALENPVGIISNRIRKPDQIIQPYQFGEDASKKTCLWLHGLPPLKPTGYVEPRIVNGKPRWGNQTDSGQNKLAPSDTRWKERSATYHGIARAMAQQWSNVP
jgi:hypothetical protein